MFKRLGWLCIGLGFMLHELPASAAGPGGRASPVAVAQAQLLPMAPVNWVVGEVVSRDDARLAAQISARLDWLADEGAQVERGDVVARFDDGLHKAAQTEAKADVASVEARLGYLRREVKRLERLAKQNNAARTQLDETEAERDSAISDLASAQARLQAAALKLRDTELRAPFNGVVSERLLRVGEWAAAGDPVVRMLDTSMLEIRAGASLTLSPYLEIGAELAVIADGEQSMARLRSVVPAGQDKSRLMNLRLDPSAAGHQLMAGQLVRLALPTARPETVLTVPRDALVLRRSGGHLFKIGPESTAAKVAVEVGIAAGDLIQVSGDLKAGDQVVIRGNERLRPGQAVSIMGGAGQ